jgi:hypothetical protein
MQAMLCDARYSMGSRDDTPVTMTLMKRKWEILWGGSEPTMPLSLWKKNVVGVTTKREHRQIANPNLLPLTMIEYPLAMEENTPHEKNIAIVAFPLQPCSRGAENTNSTIAPAPSGQ